MSRSIARVFLSVLGLLLVWLAGAPTLFAQVALCRQPVTGPLPSYAVTSVKEESQDDKQLGADETGDGLYLRNVTLGTMIIESYGLAGYQIIGVPDWGNARRWQVEAKADDAEIQKLHAMNKADAQIERCLLLQSLLAERFKLVIHRETRMEPGFALLVAKGGPKLKEASPSRSGQPSNQLIFMHDGTLTFRGFPISRLAAVLSNSFGRTVVDKTGLTENYELTIPWTRSEFEATTNSPDDANSNGDSATSIFTILQEQLGLRLESIQTPTDTIVIDHAEEPSPN